MASQQTSSQAQPKAKIFDTSPMAATFVATPGPKTAANRATTTATQVKATSIEITYAKASPGNSSSAVYKSKPKAKGAFKRKATQTKPLWEIIASVDWVSFDAEFQDVAYPGENFKPQLAWVAVVGPDGKVLYNTFARQEDNDPPGTKRKLPPSRYGVTWDALKYRNGAVNAREVEKNVKKIFEGRTVVIHAGKQDKLAFQYEQAFEAAKEVVDTQKVFAYLQFDGQPKLALAADVILGKVVQGGGGGDHSPVEDAQTAGELFVVGLEKGLISK